MPNVTVLDSSQFSRSVRLVKFLREAVAIKAKRVLEVQRYPTVMWFADLPLNLQDIRSPLITEGWPESDAHWLKVARLQETPRPIPPAVCRPWLIGVDLNAPAT